MREAAGFLLFARDTGRALFLLRRDGTWGLPGGFAEPGDQDPVDTALRELGEETGYAGALDYATEGAVTYAPGLRYVTLEATVPEEFRVELDDEHVTHAWEFAENALYAGSIRPMHAGAHEAASLLYERLHAGASAPRG